MKTLTRGLLTVVLLWAGFALPLRATTIFDNSATDLHTRFNPGTYEVGDEVLLASTERYLTDFSFEFWGVNTASPTTFAGAVEVRVRFYDNTGAPFNGYPTPSPASFFDSGWFSLGGTTPRSTVELAAGSDFPTDGLWLPSSDITWSVQFQGMGATDTVGVDIYGPPVVGDDYYDYWQNNGTTWTSQTNTVPMNFAAKMDANEAVPEPSTLAISLVGGLGILTMVRRLRRTN